MTTMTPCRAICRPLATCSIYSTSVTVATKGQAPAGFSLPAPSHRHHDVFGFDAHAKSHGSAPRCRAHDEMKIAGVKTVRDPPLGLIQHSALFPHRPITRQDRC